MFEDFPVMSSSTADKQVGALQFQFRGNYPSAYTHDDAKPLKINGAAEDVKLGQLMAALSAGRVYEMGEAQPVFESVKALPQEASPDFSGKVFAKKASQVRSLIDRINPNTMVVMDDAVLGDHLKGTQVKGWKLTFAGYKYEAPFACCGMSLGGVGGVDPRYMATKEELDAFVKGALQAQSGDYGTTFEFKFQLPDQEKQIVKKGENIFGVVSDMDGKFNPSLGGFGEQMEEVRLACTCIQCWRFPCNFTQKKTFCCTMPCYAQKVNSTEVQPFSYGKPGADSPPQVIMTPGTTFAQIVGARKDAWAPPA